MWASNKKGKIRLPRQRYEMRNPWIDLPGTAPFVLACDQQGILDFNNKAKPEHKIHLAILTEPYTVILRQRYCSLTSIPGSMKEMRSFSWVMRTFSKQVEQISVILSKNILFTFSIPEMLCLRVITGGAEN